MGMEAERDGRPPDRKEESRGLSRREFIEGAGTALVVAGAVPTLGMVGPRRAEEAKAAATSKTTIRLTVNGDSRRVEVDDRWTLAELLRDHLELTGTKIGCNRGECGACTVLLDGKPVYSCSQLAVWADGRTIRTVEGLRRGDEISPLQRAFMDHNGPQCGFCTSGQLMTATALLEENPDATPDEVRAAMVGNLCRCSNYNAIVEAVTSVASGGGSR
jgi:xanthine dehydrogenase YagT iron-sulfur-binding subunit